MTPSARLSAAIEILGVMEMQHRPAGVALKDWGQSHRFAGSGDRAAIGTLIFDAMRRRASSAWIMGEETPRAILLGALRQTRGLNVDSLSALCNGDKFAPAPLTDGERERLGAFDLESAPAHVRGNYPEWLAGSFAAVFGEDAVKAGQALAERAPVDLRANTLKATREQAMKQLDHLNPIETPLSPWGLRIAVGPDGRGPALQAEPAYVKGLVEVQDEGSQLAALLAGAEPDQQVLDLCAGGGGKSLALAAIMENRGQIYASDSDGRRLTPAIARLERAGARNVQIRTPRGAADILTDLKNHCDLVLVDAPCTGTGSWRRNPDAKWRTRASALELRLGEQRTVLETAAACVKKGGILTYVTCSILREENEDQVAAFLEKHPDYLPRDAAHMARKAGVPALAEHASKFGPGIRMAPHTTGTDGFYVAVLARS